MNQLVAFLKENCKGWVLLEHQTRDYEGDSYGIFQVSDLVARYLGGNMLWVEDGKCLAHPYFGPNGREEWDPPREISRYETMKEIRLYDQGYGWGIAWFFPLDKREELERAMYERKLSSRERTLVLMRKTELRP